MERTGYPYWIAHAINEGLRRADRNGGSGVRHPDAGDVAKSDANGNVPIGTDLCADPGLRRWPGNTGINLHQTGTDPDGGSGNADSDL